MSSRPRRVAGAAALAAAALALAAAPAAASGPAKDPDAVTLGVTAGGATASSDASGGFGRTLPGIRRLLVTFEDSPGAARASARLAGLGAVTPLLAEAGVWSLSPDDPASARDRVLTREAVAGAEWSLARATAERPRPAPPLPLGPAPTFTDPLFTPVVQWGLWSGQPAWGADLTTPPARPRIAVLDSGIDETHEEWGGPGSPLVAPRSTLRGDDDASDGGESGHGTHVAGIAAAPANGVGVVGVAPAAAATAEVIPVQIANRVGESTDYTMIRGIRHAVTNGAKVVNISAGGEGFSRAFQDAILWATREGAVVVASVGNEGSGANTLNFPAAYRHVVGVGAQCDEQPSPECPQPYAVATFSNRNRSVNVIAPGVNVVSSVPRRVSEGEVRPGYALKDGTSMSAPYVAGVAALVIASNANGLSPFQVLRQLQNTAVNQGPPGRDAATGYGVVNPRAAVTFTAPVNDASEVNDDVKWVAGAKRLAQSGESLEVEASIDRNDDQDDVYAVSMARGERLEVQLTYRRGIADLYLWRPGTPTVRTQRANYRRDLIRYRGGARKTKTIVHVATARGRHFVNVYARRGSSDYTLTLVRG